MMQLSSNTPQIWPLHLNLVLLRGKYFSLSVSTDHTPEFDARSLQPIQNQPGLLTSNVLFVISLYFTITMSSSPPLGPFKSTCIFSASLLIKRSKALDDFVTNSKNLKKQKARNEHDLTKTVLILVPVFAGSNAFLKIKKWHGQMV